MLLRMVPRLADRLMECSNEECMGMADLVSLMCFTFKYGLIVITLVQDTKGRL
jgi:hypothetical protein